MKTEVEIVVEDPMGAYSGIQIYGEHVEMKPDEDRIRISGRMRSTSDRLAASLHLEPEIAADLMNSLDEVVVSSSGTHIGEFWATRNTSFALQFEQVSGFLPWQDLKKIKIRVCFIGK